MPTVSQTPRNMNEATPGCRMIKLFKQSIFPNNREEIPQVWLCLPVIPALVRRIAVSSKPGLGYIQTETLSQNNKIKFKSLKHDHGHGWQPNSCCQIAGHKTMELESVKKKNFQLGILHYMTMPSKNQDRVKNFLVQKQEELISSKHTLQKVQKEVYEAKSDNMREQIWWTENNSKTIVLSIILSISH